MDIFALYKITMILNRQDYGSTGRSQALAWGPQTKC